MTASAAAATIERSAAPLLAVDRLRIEFPTRRGVLTAVHEGRLAL